MRSNAYDAFAQLYDSSYRGWRPSPWKRYAPVLADAVRGAESVCDLACGTGQLAAQIARKGLLVFAVDAHRGMLAEARRRAAKSRGRMIAIRADMRRFHLPQKVGAICCFFDSLNHLRKPNDLFVVFERCARNLRPGGFLVFDVNTPAGVAYPWPLSPAFASGRHRGRRWRRIASSLGFDPARRRGGTQLDWFLEAGRGGREARFRHVRERYWEIGWPKAEVRKALKRAGFRSIATWDGSALEPNLGRGLRTFFRARLPPAELSSPSPNPSSRERNAKGGKQAKDFRGEGR